ncbi:MAG: T9SS type A sorting domain-containing protein [Calditrichaeota bacterium]|nr:T9SS type A sorting domain-containing protein [Calditrichota bacterium]
MHPLSMDKRKIGERKLLDKSRDGADAVCCWLIHGFFVLLFFWGWPGIAIPQVSVYYKNFVRHSEGEFCGHVPPVARFQVYRNHQYDTLLTENAPRWEEMGDPNIPGSGVFGVELGNFPGLQAGDSVSIAFYCRQTQQRGILKARVEGIPWAYFPSTLRLRPTDFPEPPQDLRLNWTTSGERRLEWTAKAETFYDIYRKALYDTVAGGQCRNLYVRIARQVAEGWYVDLTAGQVPHGYVLIPYRNGVAGPHSREIVDYPPAPVHLEAAVVSGEGLGVALSWIQLGDTSGFQYHIHRSRESDFYPDQSTRIGISKQARFLDTTVVAGERYFYRVVPVNAYQIPGEASHTVGITVQMPKTSDPDLDVLFISRLPRYPRYEVVYGPPEGYNPHLKPGTEHRKHYPDPGELMRYVAVIRNSGGATSPPFQVIWRVNGIEYARQTIAPLIPGQRVRHQIRLPWKERPDTIECRVVAADSSREVSYRNNAVTIVSHGLAFRFYIEASARAFFENRANPMGSYSFEDWAQLHIHQLNAFFQQAKYPPFAPDGVPEAVFLDTVSYHPDGALPVYGTHAPENLMWDGQWGFRGDASSIAYFRDVVFEQQRGMDWALLHELGHQLGLIDLYNMDVQQSEFRVIEPRTGRPPDLEPIAWDVLYYCSRKDYLMHTNFQAGISDHSAGALWRNRGRRRGFFGDYLADIPAENTLILRDASGQRLRHARVTVYQMQDNVIPNIPKYRGITDDQGRFVFPHVTDSIYFGGIYTKNPFSSYVFPDPHVVGTNAVLFIRVEKGDSVGYHFMDICDFNVAYWSGNRDSATYERTIRIWRNIPPASLPNPEEPSVRAFRLNPIFPNPFNHRCLIAFQIPEKERVRLDVYNIGGERVRRILDALLLPGRYLFAWNGQTDRGQPVPSGMYFVVLQTDTRRAVRKVLLIR